MEGLIAGIASSAIGRFFRHRPADHGLQHRLCRVRTRHGGLSYDPRSGAGKRRGEGRDPPSKAAPGMPIQIVCYERSDDIGFGVSGVATRARGIRGSFPDLDPARIPRASAIRTEKLVYLLDPVGASRRSAGLRVADRLVRTVGRLLPGRHDALESVDTAVSRQARGIAPVDRTIQPVGGLPAHGVRASADLARHAGRRAAGGGRRSRRSPPLVDQGTDTRGRAGPGFLPGMDVRGGPDGRGGWPGGAPSASGWMSCTVCPKGTTAGTGL